ncbi:MAG: hypothetical protein M3R52_13110, partial [Acidobacteriota bacterium]|nr:hypothetical protein [Acidobacteriota bacterium]
PLHQRIGLKHAITDGPETQVKTDTYQRAHCPGSNWKIPNAAGRDREGKIIASSTCARRCRGIVRDGRIQFVAGFFCRCPLSVVCCQWFRSPD